MTLFLEIQFTNFSTPQIQHHLKIKQHRIPAVTNFSTPQIQYQLKLFGLCGSRFST